MGRFGGETPKRHRLWSNDQLLLEGISCKAGYMFRAEQSQCPGQTTKKYVDRNGVKRHVGIKEALRNSQHLVSMEVISYFKFLVLTIILVMILTNSEYIYEFMDVRETQVFHSSLW